MKINEMFKSNMRRTASGYALRVLITGDNRFKVEIETAIGRKVEPAPRGRPRKQPSTASLMENTNVQLM